MSYKIGIITLNSYFNYGNRLQNYALQEVITSLGGEVDTLLIEQERRDLKGKQERSELTDNTRPELKGTNYKDISSKGWNRLLKGKRMGQKNLENSKFEEFNKNNLKGLSYLYPNIQNLSEIIKNYDFFIVGSDEISSMDNFNQLDSYVFASVPMIADPAFVLTKEEWIAIGKEDEKRPKDPYILTYFLEEQPKDVWKKIKLLSKEQKLKIVKLNKIKYNQTNIGPQEFIDYIQHCKVLFTDAYYGCVFSVLMERPFVVLDSKEKKINSDPSIDPLLTMFRLQSRRWERVSKNRILRMEFALTKAILTYERGRTMEYLKEALFSKK